MQNVWIIGFTSLSIRIPIVVSIYATGWLPWRVGIHRQVSVIIDRDQPTINQLLSMTNQELLANYYLQGTIINKLYFLLIITIAKYY